VQIHPADAHRLGIAAGDLVELSNDHGLVRAVAEPCADLGIGQLFFPMHWNARFAHPTRVSTLVDRATDPLSGQPESKHAAVTLSRCRVGSWIRLACAQPLPDRLLSRGVLFWIRLPTAGGWRYELALAPEHGAQTYLTDLGQCLSHDNAVEFTDTASGERRVLLEGADGMCLLAAFVTAARAELPPASFLASLFDGGHPQSAWRLLAGPAGSAADCSPAVCTCYEISERAIRAALLAGARTAEDLGRRLGCGTNCGSCVPELRALIATHAS
jgi:assimilatory nitrate reductase catalytic subunit